MNIDALFPKAQTRPIVLRNALTGYDEAKVEKPLPPDLLRYVPHHACGWNTDVQIYQKLNGRSGGTINAKWCDWERVCGTIPKMETSIAGHIHPNKKRFLNICELQRLGSFPDAYTLIGKRQDCVMRIGNSVPPLFMRAIAGQIAYAMFGGAEPVQKLRTIDDYPAYLEAAWLQHLAPRAEDAPTVISTFAGAGGSSLGYSMAGFRELLAVEWDDNAVATFKLNFPDVPVYHGDIAKLTVEEVLQRTG